MKRILFFAEAVSLAHAARPYVLARSLDPTRYEIHFASANRYPLDFESAQVRNWPIHSITPEAFLSALARGRPIYRRDTLSDYVEEDLRVLDAVQPDLVVGDFRLSLAVSAPLRGVHYMSITNAHWSPFSSRKRLPFPDHTLSHWVGVPFASRLFSLIEPVVLARHAAPLNQLRRAYGLTPLDGLRAVYTSADTTLYADVPELVSTDALPGHHHYIGPILWSPEVPRPAWWAQLSPDDTLVYVSLGSSGQLRALGPVLAGLSALPVTVLLATAGRTVPDSLSQSVKVAAYLPGLEAARRSAVVVCNGGSAPVYQALAEGTPVLGVPSNMDQHLTMAAVTEAGAGLSIRAEAATADRVREAVGRILAEPQFAARARQVSQWFAAYAAGQRFSKLAKEILAAH